MAIVRWLGLKPLSEVTSIAGKLWWWLWTSTLVTVGLAALLCSLGFVVNHTLAPSKALVDFGSFWELLRGFAPVFFGGMGLAVSVLRPSRPTRFPDDHDQ